jgi:aminoglycoside phosphotransferase (APT) family kinase protein
MYSSRKFGTPLAPFSNGKSGRKKAAMKQRNVARAERDGESIENRLAIDYQIFSGILCELIDDIATNATTRDVFLLEHGDLAAHNIFVDGEFNVTAIIDWDLCSTVPLETLITHPPLPNRSFEVD